MTPRMVGEMPMTRPSAVRQPSSSLAHRLIHAMDVTNATAHSSQCKGPAAGTCLLVDVA